MADTYRAEVFREEVDDLTEKLLAIARTATVGYHRIDRSVIISAALANVACMSDGMMWDPEGVTGRIERMTRMWKRVG